MTEARGHDSTNFGIGWEQEEARRSTNWSRREQCCTDEFPSLPTTTTSYRPAVNVAIEKAEGEHVAATMANAVFISAELDVRCRIVTIGPKHVGGSPRQH